MRSRIITQLKAYVSNIAYVGTFVFLFLFLGLNFHFDLKSLVVRHTDTYVRSSLFRIPNTLPYRIHILLCTSIRRFVKKLQNKVPVVRNKITEELMKSNVKLKAKLQQQQQQVQQQHP